MENEMLDQENKQPIPTPKKLNAKSYLKPEIQAALLLNDITQGSADIGELGIAIRDEINSITEQGSTKASSLLAANIVTLNILSRTMLSRAAKSYTVETVQAYADIGLRAQEQARKTILALHHLQNPKQNMYVAQQNVANIQQINNHTKAKPENELISEATHAALDQRRTSETISNDPRVTAMAELYRPENNRGEGK